MTLQRILECRAYKLSDKFLETVADDQRDKRVPAGFEPITYTFARYSGMIWPFYVFDAPKNGKEESIVEGVTLYLADKKIILVLDTKKSHIALTKSMSSRGYLKN